MAARCDGVPFYIEQLVRALRKKPADESAETRVPEGLYEPLIARLHDGANLVQVVEAASDHRPPRRSRAAVLGGRPE